MPPFSFFLRNIATAICACCAVCILSCIEDIAQYFNHYAFTQVAIYGKDYCSAAKSTWALIKTRGIDAIINDNLIGTVLTMGGLFIGLICAGVTVGYLFSIIPASSANAGVAIVVALLALFIGMGEFAILAEVIESGTATTFVCLAENPEALRRTKPDLFNKVQAVYPQVNLF